MTIYKALNGLNATNGGDYRYPGPGRWTRHLDGELEPCVYGYHLAVGPQVLDWLSDTLYEAEPCPDHDPVDGGNKLVTCRVRLVRKLNWDDQIARLFAADCAEAALLGERSKGREPDPRSWAAVEASRAFARGEIGAAAWDAAGAAARAAAWDAAWAAAWDAARDAARDALYGRFEAYVSGGSLEPVEALYS